MDLTLKDRRIITKHWANGDRGSDIAKDSGLVPSTIYVEMARGKTGELDCNFRPAYDPEQEQAIYQVSMRKCGNLNGATKKMERRKPANKKLSPNLRLTEKIHGVKMSIANKASSGCFFENCWLNWLRRYGMQHNRPGQSRINGCGVPDRSCWLC